MPRKATKPVAASASRNHSKRPAPDTPARQSKRARATARKSYVELASDTDEAVGSDKEVLSAAKDEDDAVASDYEDHSDQDPLSESEVDETASEEEAKPKKATPRGRLAKQSALPIHTKLPGEEDMWKQGAKLAPGTQLIIKKPKARDPGNTPYTEDTIHPNTMLFLQDLAKNNERQWLKMHDPDYRAALQDFSAFTEQVSEKVIKADETIPELPVKDVIYRIYRDVRFSKDPTPYKSYFSAAWSRTGRKGPYAHYYVQIQPNGGSFVGGGFWQPDAASLSKLRRDVDRKPHKIKAVLTNAGIRRAFLGGVQADEKRAVKAFTSLTTNQSTALKRHPKGYDHDHKDIELLRLRNFTIGRKLVDDEVIGPGGLDRVAELIRCLVPFITYLNSVVMPDEDSSGSSENESDAESDDGAAADEDGA